MTKKEAINKFRNSEIHLKDIPEFKNDKDIVLAAVSNTSQAIQFASKELQIQQANE